jgi:Capsular polysaccharide synthesis, CpsB/CapC
VSCFAAKQSLNTQRRAFFWEHLQGRNGVHFFGNTCKGGKDLGFILQVNLLSLTGYYGKSAARAAKYMLDKGLVGFVGTDLHHGRHIATLQATASLNLFNKYVKEGALLNKDLLQ